MNGRLSDHPLAELVREISDTRLSGALRLERERAKAAVYFDAGDIAVAVSNARSLRLLEGLRRRGPADRAGPHAAGGGGVCGARGRPAPPPPAGFGRRGGGGGRASGRPRRGLRREDEFGAAAPP